MSRVVKVFRYLLRILDDFLRLFIIYIPSPTGAKLRYLYYKRKFKRCGKNVIIDEGVIIINPEWISLGDNVWIDRYCVFMAGPINNVGSIIKRKESKDFKWQEGELIIGSGVHIGSFNVISALGGVFVGNNVTTSSSVKIYSLSNFPYNEADLSQITYANYMSDKNSTISYIVSPIIIQENVWIALNTVVLGGIIGKYSFIASNSLVTKDIPFNSYAVGNPAKRIKKRFKLKEKIND